MKDLNVLLNHQDELVQEAELKAAINSMHNMMLKEEMIVMLNKNYGITKDSNAVVSTKDIHDIKKSSKMVNLRFIISAAAIFIIGLFSYIYFIDVPSPYELANQYAYADIIRHPGTTKGANDDTTIELNAINAFNAKEWESAAKQFESISNPTADILYYQALSHFYQKNYESAIALFNNESLKQSVFSQEVKWFLGLSYWLAHKEQDARNILTSIQPQDWKYKEAQELLK